MVLASDFSISSYAATAGRFSRSKVNDLLLKTPSYRHSTKFNYQHHKKLKQRKNMLSKTLLAVKQKLFLILAEFHLHCYKQKVFFTSLYRHRGNAMLTLTPAAHF